MGERRGVPSPVGAPEPGAGGSKPGAGNRPSGEGNVRASGVGTPEAVPAQPDAVVEVVKLVEIDTPHGPARVHLTRAGAEPSRRLLMLGHGAGGGVGAPDLLLAADVAIGRGFDVALVEQPYRVAGRRAPAPAAQVDAAWTAVAAWLTASAPRDVLVAGGRSFGGRVACRTAEATGAAGVLCLAFPTHPPGRPDRSRQPELDAVTVPVLVITGDRDPFGAPTGSATTRVVSVAGDHSLKKDHARIRTEIDRWLGELVGEPATTDG